MNVIPLIEINNPILLCFASEADNKGNKNSLLDTPDEFSIFQTNAKLAISIGLCTQQDFDDVMQIDFKKIKTQVTTTEDLRNSKLKNSTNGNDYDKKYYEKMKEKFKNEIRKCEKELIKAKKELEKAQKNLEIAEKDLKETQKEFEESHKDEIENAKKESEKLKKAKIEKAKKEQELERKQVTFEGMFLTGVLGILALATVGAIGSEIMLGVAWAAAGATAGTDMYMGSDAYLKRKMRRDKISNVPDNNDPYEYIMNEMYRDPEYVKSNTNYDSLKKRNIALKNIIDEFLNRINSAKDNFDTIVKQNDFLENMENYVKILDQRESFLNKFKFE